MIEPTKADIGRSVVYCADSWEREQGVITSFNAAFVFVRYQGEQNSKATRRRDLDWPDVDHPHDDVLAA